MSGVRARVGPILESQQCPWWAPRPLALLVALDHGEFLGHVEGEVVFLGRAPAGTFAQN